MARKILLLKIMNNLCTLFTLCIYYYYTWILFPSSWNIGDIPPRIFIDCPITFVILIIYINNVIQINDYPRLSASSLSKTEEEWNMSSL